MYLLHAYAVIYRFDPAIVLVPGAVSTIFC